MDVIFLTGKSTLTLLEMTPYFLMLWALIVATAIDFDWKIIPDEISFLLIGTGILCSFLNPLLGTTVGERVIQSIGGMATGVVVLWTLGGIGSAVFKQPAMGGGDVKLLGGIGAFLGWKGIFISLFAASICGAIFSLVGMAFKLLKPRNYIPFGPFLSFGALIALLLRVFSGKFS
jgi:leader peptidase (prepilin peptidase)/N-methyltransferase